MAKDSSEPLIVASIADGWWVTLAQDKPRRWTAQVWGEELADSELVCRNLEEAQAAALKFARDHLRSAGVATRRHVRWIVPWTVEYIVKLS